MKIIKKDYKKSLSNEEKEKEHQYGCERYKNLTQDEKKSFSSIEKNIIKWEKMHYFNYKQLFQKVMRNIRMFSQINFEANLSEKSGKLWIKKIKTIYKNG